MQFARHISRALPTKLVHIRYFCSNPTPTSIYETIVGVYKFGLWRQKTAIGGLGIAVTHSLSQVYDPALTIPTNTLDIACATPWAVVGPGLFGYIGGYIPEIFIPAILFKCYHDMKNR